MNISKYDARHRMKLYRKQLSKEDVINKSENICNNLLNCEVLNESTEVMLGFAAYNSEPHTDIIHYAVKEKYPSVRIAYPKVSDDKLNMDFYYIDDYSELVPGYMGIPEPDSNISVKVSPDDIINIDSGVVIIVPGLAFDSLGTRVGYGGGFYDRYLRRYNNLTKAAICYDGQFLSDSYIEKDDYDIAVDYIVTDSQVIRI